MDGIRGRARRALGHLCVILKAGERGYAVAAANVNNRALKMLFRKYAKQRADFKAELLEQTGEAAAGLHSLIDLMAMVHRGRINIFATMTIGDQNRERVVLKEVLAGERATLRAYRSALKAGLPASVSRLVEQQYEAIQATLGEVESLHGKGRKQVVVRLFDSEADGRNAAEALRDAGFMSSQVHQVPAEDQADLYRDDRSATLLETILSGAAGGALWGAVSGALAGFGVVHLPTLGLQHAPLAIQEMAWAETALGAIFSGGFVGAMLGIFIGWGVQGGDNDVYDEGRRRGHVLLKVETEEARALQAAQIWHRLTAKQDPTGSTPWRSAEPKGRLLHIDNASLRGIIPAALPAD